MVYMLAILALSRMVLFVISSCHVNVQDVSEAAHRKGIELSLLSSVQDPGLTAVLEGVHGTGSVDQDLSFLCQPAAVPYFLCQSGHRGSCLTDALVKLSVETEGV